MLTEQTSIVHPSFKHGNNFKIGHFSVIEEDVEVGDNVSIGHFCMLKSGTRFANNVTFADCCTTTGICYLGNNVGVRTGSCVSKSVIVEDDVFIGAGIMSSHTKHIHHRRPQVPPRQLITRIGFGAVIGSRSNLSAGITITDNVVIGYSSVVTKDVLEQGVYVGSPLRKLADLPKEMIVPKPPNYKEHQFPPDMIKKYLPYYRLNPE